MKTIYKSPKGTMELKADTNFYKSVAEELIKEDYSSGRVTVTVEAEDVGKVSYLVSERSGTMFITETSNSMPDSVLDKDIKPRFLTCVKPETNAYKFYKLEAVGDIVRASYGRMGVQKGQLFGERSFDYPLSMYWIKYYEKIQKGYVDRSDLYLSKDEPETTEKKDEKDVSPQKPVSKVSAMLFQKLKAFAKKAVEQAEVKVPITHAIIQESKRLLDEMRGTDDVETFNSFLMELISILQRPVRTGDGRGVKEIMAKGTSDFSRIILREADLIQAMEGTLTHTGPQKVGTGSFEDYQIEVYEATEKQKTQVMRHLSDSLKGKVKNIYRVIPKAQQDRFDDYIKEHKIHTVKQLWHGSRNQNWMSIVMNGLKLNPDAIITGKMFGHGIYFAPSSMKSWNYTSYRGTSWARGTESSAFMGLYAVAYGTPLDTSTWSASTDYKAEVQKAKADCLHAHAGSALMNDEIVFYDEAAIVLNYIVEFE